MLSFDRDVPPARVDRTAATEDPDEGHAHHVRVEDALSRPEAVTVRSYHYRVLVGHPTILVAGRRRLMVNRLVAAGQTHEHLAGFVDRDGMRERLRFQLFRRHEL